MLVPKAGRDDFFIPDNRDLGRLRHWRTDAIAYFDRIPSNDWDCIALAQHHGLATRLLDWTYNPLVALYFACCSEPNADGAVFFYDPVTFVESEVLPLDKATTGVGFIPAAFNNRILNQKAIFTVHNPPNQEIQLGPHSCLEGESNLQRMVVPSGLKDPFLKMLDDYGINEVTLFPDLDGWSRHLNWETIGMVNNAKNGEGKA